MGGGGGRKGGGGSSTTTTSTQVPEDMRALMRFITPGVEEAWGPHALARFQVPQPETVPGLDPAQLGAYQFAALRQDPSFPTLNAPELLALRNLATLSTGPIGSSPATTEAMKFWESTVGEKTRNDLALAGLGRSGALESELGVARSAAEATLLMQEIANRLATVGPLAEIGKITEERPVQREQFAFDMGEAMRQISQSQMEARLSDFLRQQAMAESIAGVVTGTAPGAWGQTGTTLQRFTRPATGIPLGLGFGGGK